MERIPYKLNTYKHYTYKHYTYKQYIHIKNTITI